MHILSAVLQKSEDDEQFPDGVGEHHQEVGLQAAVLVETHEEQRGIGDEEQGGTNGRGEGGGAGNADPAEDGKAVHGSVDEQIQEHGIEQRLRQVRLELRENVGHH